jgi:1-acyl-sn-glycerol-3-phosphate acyltransferase
MSPLALLAQRRFSGIFWTQSIGAFSDNFFKQTLLALVAARGLTFMGLSEATIGLLASAIFMAPYFFFSATAGQLADKLDKAAIIRGLKLAEIVFAVLGALAIHFQAIDACMGVLVFFAFQAAFFGPLKYGILPQLLQEHELVTGNAWVETSTNIFILVGTILGTELIERNVPNWTVGAFLVAISVVGYFASCTIPSAPGDPDVQVDWNPIVPTLQTLRLVAEKRAVLNSILGISWFWALGAVMLSAFPFYAKLQLHCELRVSTLLFVIFSIGVAVGSMWCERLSYGRLELGLVPFGSLGISLFLLGLCWIGSPFPETAHAYTWEHFIHTAAGCQIAACVFFFSVFSGFFIVPLYTLIQQRSDPSSRARIIAGNNIVNALFIVAAVLLTEVLHGHLHMTFSQVFGVMAILNGLVAVYIYSLIPEFSLRFVAYLLTHCLYRLKVIGEEKIPETGGLVLVANHVSFADWLVVMAAVRRPPHFVMWYTYFEMPVVKWLFRDAGVIPISSARLRPKILEAAFRKIRDYLQEGEVICIFPEGQITRTGQLNTFRNGVERMVEDSPVPVVPIALRGLWGSNFSRYKGGFWGRFFRRPFRSKIEVVIGDPIPADQVEASKLQEIVEKLRGDRL